MTPGDQPLFLEARPGSSHLYSPDFSVGHSIQAPQRSLSAQPKRQGQMKTKTESRVINGRKQDVRLRAEVRGWLCALALSLLPITGTGVSLIWFMSA